MHVFNIKDMSLNLNIKYIAYNAIRIPLTVTHHKKYHIIFVQ